MNGRADRFTLAPTPSSGPTGIHNSFTKLFIGIFHLYAPRDTELRNISKPTSPTLFSNDISFFFSFSLFSWLAYLVRKCQTRRMVIYDALFQAHRVRENIEKMQLCTVQYTYVKGMFYSVIGTGLGLFYFSSVIVKR